LRLIDRNHDALALLAEAEPTCSTACRFADLSRLAHLWGNLYFPLDHTAACQAAHEKALDYAERSGSIELKARALGGLGDAAYADGRRPRGENMTAYSMENPVFVACMIVAAIMVLKIMGQGWMTVYRMNKSEAELLTPEDLRKHPVWAAAGAHFVW
jgi:hypothetical protein